MPITLFTEEEHNVDRRFDSIRRSAGRHQGPHPTGADKSHILRKLGDDP
jgi:hypothetical protein